LERIYRGSQASAKTFNKTSWGEFEDAQRSPREKQGGGERIQKLQKALLWCSMIPYSKEKKKKGGGPKRTTKLLNLEGPLHKAIPRFPDTPHTMRGRRKKQRVDRSD